MSVVLMRKTVTRKLNHNQSFPHRVTAYGPAGAFQYVDDLESRDDERRISTRDQPDEQDDDSVGQQVPPLKGKEYLRTRQAVECRDDEQGDGSTDEHRCERQQDTFAEVLLDQCPSSCAQHFAHAHFQCSFQ